jgi:hypothetical protein
MNKQQFVSLLGNNIPDEMIRSQMVQHATTLIPDQSMRMRLAVGAYKRFHPECEGEPPIDHVLCWLLHAGAMPYLADLELRLARIHQILMGTGLVDIDEDMNVPGPVMFKLRVLSYIDPAEKPASFRKQRSSQKSK